KPARPSAGPPPGFDASVHGALFDAYPDGVLLVDPQGRVVMANQAASRLLGYSITQLIGLAVETLVPEKVRHRHAGLRQGYALSPKARPMGTDMELSARRADGSELMVEIALSPLATGGAHYVVVSMRDIGAYPRVQRALIRARYSEYTAQFSRLAVDTPDPRELLNCAPAIAATALEAEAVAVWLLERSPPEFRIASNYSAHALEAEAMPVANRPDTMLGYVAALGAPVLVANYQRESRFKIAASLRDEHARSGLAVPMLDAGRCVGVLLAHSARTARFGDDEQKFLEALANLLVTSLQRAHTEAQLSHSQRLESVGQLTGGIAHDFNNLLTVIQGNLQMLAEQPGVAGSEAAQQMLGAALRAGQRGAELTGKLLAFSRRQALAAGPVDVAALLHSLAGMLGRTIGDQIRIEVHAPSSNLKCLADAGQLESALLNIAINARDAMPDGGILTFSSASGSAPADVGAVDGPRSRFVGISVRDTGCGMSEAVRERAFEPFFTTKAAGKGTGLGLSTVYGFVTQSKGHLKVDSAPGRGTTVTIYLPQLDADDASTDASDALPDATPRGLQVLLVEDDPDVRGVALGFLAALHCEVSAHADAESALAELRAGAPCDLLFSDVMLGPGLDGVQLAEQARQLRPTLAVLLCTGYAEPLAEGGLDHAGRWPLLGKPYTREAMKAAMSKALGRSASA
ncbi:MAG: PAS domain S-box protein, partial [Rhizobacter sp.]|nr:PAS domain S-box protein [Rhizobacter sp.]